MDWVASERRGDPRAAGRLRPPNRPHEASRLGLRGPAAPGRRRGRETRASRGALPPTYGPSSPRPYLRRHRGPSLRGRGRRSVGSPTPFVLSGLSTRGNPVPTPRRPRTAANRARPPASPEGRTPARAHPAGRAPTGAPAGFSPYARSSSSPTLDTGAFPGASPLKPRLWAH